MQTHSQNNNLIFNKPPVPNNSNKKRQNPLINQQSHHLLRTNISPLKKFEKSSADKSIRERDFQKCLRYYKTDQLKNQLNKSIDGSPQSKIGDNRQNLQKHNKKTPHLTIRVNHQQKLQSTKLFDNLSGISGSRKSKQTQDKPEDYYLYWKNKAHQYLESNMKLMEINRKLIKQNQSLKEEQPKTIIEQIPAPINQKQVQKEIRNISLMYLHKIDQLEKQLKIKEVKIVSIQIQLLTLQKKLAGDEERKDLLQKFRVQVQELQKQNKALKGQLRSWKSSSALQIKSPKQRTKSSRQYHPSFEFTKMIK